jgi:hypothetical protein
MALNVIWMYETTSAKWHADPAAEEAAARKEAPLRKPVFRDVREKRGVVTIYLEGVPFKKAGDLSEEIEAGKVLAANDDQIPGEEPPARPTRSRPTTPPKSANKKP